MMEICKHCTLYCRLNSKRCIKPLKRGNPKVIFILPHPEFEDDQGNYFCGPKGSFIRRALEQAGIKDNYLLTYMIKCFPTTKVGYLPTNKSKEPTTKDYKYCLPLLLEEIKQYPGAIIQTFGKVPYTILTGEDTYMHRVGSEVTISLSGLDRSLIPNFDASYLYRKGNLYPDFLRVLQRCFLGLKKPKFEEIVRVLSPDDAIAEIDKTISYYKEGKITHVYHDIENSISLFPWDGGEITVHAFCHDADPRAFAIPLEINNDIRFGVNVEYSTLSVSEIQRSKIHKKVGELLNTVPVVGHNYKYDARWLVWKDIIDLKKLRIHADTMIMGFMTLNSDKTHGLGLEDLAVRLLFADPWEHVIKKGYLDNFNLVKDRHYGNIPTNLICPYAARDVFWCRALYRYFCQHMPIVSKDINRAVTDSILSFLEPEVKGIKIDTEMYSFLEKNYSGIQKNIMEQVRELPKVKEIIKKYKEPLILANEAKRKKLTDEELTDKAFSIGSIPKLREILFEFYKLKPNSNFKTKNAALQTGKEVLDYYLTGDLKVAETVLEKEAKFFIESILIWKRIEKLYTSYINTVPKYSFNDLYRPDYALSFVTTGRLSSVFHTIPNRCDVKRLFISRWREEGGLILAADYSQLELRIVAALARETKFIEAFKNKIDAHKNAASLVYNKPVDKITSEERQVGKTVNFAILYMMAAKGLADELGKSEEEAQKILNKFYNGADNLRKWQQEQVKFGLKNGYIETVFGRRIPIKSYLSKVDRELAEAKRHCVNYPVQSSAADTAVSAALSVFQNKNKLKMKSVYIGCIHDSIEYDVYPNELIKLINLLKKNAVVKPSQIYPWLTCPLELSFELGVSWGGAIECDIEHLDAKEFVFIGEGLKKDCRMLEVVAKRSYDVSVEVLNEIKIEDSFFPHDILFRDDSKLKCKFHIRQR